MIFLGDNGKLLHYLNFDLVKKKKRDNKVRSFSKLL